jgi:hypothetical protein
VIPYRRPESVPQTNSHVVFVLHHQVSPIDQEAGGR